MGSSGGGGGGGGGPIQTGPATPMPGIPVAGTSPAFNPADYGQFQSFLPKPPSAGGGPASVATGLTDDMLVFKSPEGRTAPATSDLQNEQLRTQLADLMAQQKKMQGALDEFSKQPQRSTQPDMSATYAPMYGQ